MIDRFILLCLQNRRIIKALLFITTITILLLTLIPADQIADNRLFTYDKLGHFLIFFGWTLLYGLFMFTKQRTETKFLLIFMAGCIFGVAIEIFQGILPIGRNMDLMDAISDILASFTAILLLFVIKRRYLSREMEKQLEKIE